MSDEPGFGPETRSTYEPTVAEVAALRMTGRPVNDLAADVREVLLLPVSPRLEAAHAALAELVSRLETAEAEVAALTQERDEALKARNLWEYAAEERALVIHRSDARAEAAEAALADTKEHYAPFVTIVAALAIYGEGANLAALVDKARELNEADIARRALAAADSTPKEQPWVVLELDALRRERAELVSRLEAAEAQNERLRETQGQSAELIARTQFLRAEAAEAQVAALTQERDEQEGYPGIAHDFLQTQRRAEAAEAALADTRRALEHIASLHIPNDRRPPAWADIARSALAGGSTGQERE